MKKHLSHLVVASALLLGTSVVQAQQAEARIVSVINPTQNNGVRIGDVLKRTVTLDVAPPYQLSKQAYPMKGANQAGIELVDFKVDTTSHGHDTRYHLNYRYQVFAHARMPTVMQLPAEVLALTGGPKALTITVPAWRFWFSPLVNTDLLTAKANLQPQQKPALVATGMHRSLLAGFISLLVTSLLALLYFNADRRWLPFMGGAFAQTYRRIKRLSGKPSDDKKALMHLHQAFNEVYGGAMFASDIEAFLTTHPGYTRLRLAIETFFQRSSQVLFAAPPDDRAAFISELIMLSKALRDCERGLR